MTSRIYKHTVIHHRTRLLRHTHIPRLLLELTNSTLIRALTSINQARRDLNNNHVDRRPILFLKQQLRPLRLIEDRQDTHAINGAIGRTSLQQQVSGVPARFHRHSAVFPQMHRHEKGPPGRPIRPCGPLLHHDGTQRRKLASGCRGCRSTVACFMCLATYRAGRGGLALPCAAAEQGLGLGGAGNHGYAQEPKMRLGAVLPGVRRTPRFFQRRAGRCTLSSPIEPSGLGPGPGVPCLVRLARSKMPHS